MSPSELHREKQDFDFKVIKASAKGVLTQLQKKESILKVAFQATESEYLSYKNQLESLDRKLGAKIGLEADCEKEIEIRNREIDHVNKRLRGLRR